MKSGFAKKLAVYIDAIRNIYNFRDNLRYPSSRNDRWETFTDDHASLTSRLTVLAPSALGLYLDCILLLNAMHEHGLSTEYDRQNEEKPEHVKRWHTQIDALIEEMRKDMKVGSTPG